MTPRDVVDAIAGKLAQLWPERMIYRDFCPVDFQRPSCFLWIPKSDLHPSNAHLVRWSMEAELELFCSTDAYDIQSTEELASDQEKVLRVFDGTPLAVLDRHVLVTATAEGMEVGSAYVRFTAAWMDAWPSRTQSDTIPLMEQFSTKMTEERG